MRIVDDAVHGPVLGRVREQRQRRGEHHEMVIDSPVLSRARVLMLTERPAQRTCLHRRDALQLTEDRPQ